MFDRKEFRSGKELQLNFISNLKEMFQKVHPDLINNITFRIGAKDKQIYLNSTDDFLLNNVQLFIENYLKLYVNFMERKLPLFGNFECLEIRLKDLNELSNCDELFNYKYLYQIINFELEHFFKSFISNKLSYRKYQYTNLVLNQFGDQYKIPFEVQKIIEDMINIPDNYKYMVFYELVEKCKIITDKNNININDLCCHYNLDLKIKKNIEDYIFVNRSFNEKMELRNEIMNIYTNEKLNINH